MKRAFESVENEDGNTSVDIENNEPDNDDIPLKSYQEQLETAITTIHAEESHLFDDGEWMILLTFLTLDG